MGVTCVECNKKINNFKGYQIIAVDGLHYPSHVTDLLPLFDAYGNRIYKNYYVHRECVHEFVAHLKQELETCVISD